MNILRIRTSIIIKHIPLNISCIKTAHILGHKENLNKFQTVEIIQSMYLIRVELG